MDKGIDLKQEKNMTIEAKIDYVLNFYIQLTGRTRLSNTTAGLRSGIRARLKEGHEIEDCIKVIRWKYSQWWDDDIMKNYFNPVTLFRPSHFAIYLCEAEENLEVIIKENYEKFVECIFEKREKDKYIKFEEYKAKYLAGEVVNG